MQIVVIRTALSSVRNAVRDFARDTYGSITVEAVLWTPLYLLWFVSTFQLFNIFRIAAINEKAAYAVADYVSRQNNVPLTCANIDDMDSIFAFLIENRGPTWVRVTSFTYHQPTDGYIDPGDPLGSFWSYATDNQPARTPESLAADRNRIPLMADGANAILVETYVDTRMRDFTFSGELTTFTITTPRFITRVGFDETDPSCP